MSYYAHSITQNKNSTITYFGTQLHYKINVKLITNIYQNNKHKIKNLFNNYNSCLVTMVNNQRGFLVNNVCYGVNNIFVTVTGRTFVGFVETCNPSVKNVKCELIFHQQKLYQY